jgi:2-C-methyl-D-erythritol 4-phosphate cytidylyltransferase
LKKYAIIVAGGKGERMNSPVPKQFMLVKDLPVLAHSIFRFYTYSPLCTIIVVLPEEHMTAWKDLCLQHRFDLPHISVKGGQSRFESVRNGLSAIMEPGIVAIHDGVRPLVSLDTIDKAYRMAEEKGNGVASVKLKDSVRVLTSEGSKAMDRESLRLVQTPQCFRTDIIIDAYSNAAAGHYTDDASVAEACGISINLVEGSYNNIKITTEEDLALARLLIE